LVVWYFHVCPTSYILLVDCAHLSTHIHLSSLTTTVNTPLALQGVSHHFSLFSPDRKSCSYIHWISFLSDCQTSQIMERNCPYTVYVHVPPTFSSSVWCYTICWLLFQNICAYGVHMVWIILPLTSTITPSTVKCSKGVLFLEKWLFSMSHICPGVKVSVSTVNSTVVVLKVEILKNI